MYIHRAPMKDILESNHMLQSVCATVRRYSLVHSTRGSRASDMGHCEHRQMDEGLDCLPARSLDFSSNPCLLRTSAVLDITSGLLLLWTLITPLMAPPPTGKCRHKFSFLVIRSACCSSEKTALNEERRRRKDNHTFTYTR